MIALIKKYKIVLSSILVLLLMTCTSENSESKTESPHQKKIDSLALVKENKANEAANLKHELDSLKKHLDSIKAIPLNSAK